MPLVRQVRGVRLHLTGGPGSPQACRAPPPSRALVLTSLHLCSQLENQGSQSAALQPTRRDPQAQAPRPCRPPPPRGTPASLPPNTTLPSLLGATERHLPEPNPDSVGDPVPGPQPPRRGCTGSTGAGGGWAGWECWGRALRGSRGLPASVAGTQPPCGCVGR